MADIVYAIHSFEAENLDEISFQTGEAIVVTERDERFQDGWWKGQNMHGHTGLFPMNYTSTTPPLGFRGTPSPSVISSPGTLVQETTSKDHLMPSHTEQPVPISPRSPLSEPTATVPLEEWSVDAVASWLQSVGLDNVVENFVDQEITGDVLLDLNIDTLKELGITAYGRRYKVMSALNKLRSSAGQGENMDAMTRRAVSPPPSAVSSHTPSYRQPSYMASPPLTHRQRPDVQHSSSHQTSPVDVEGLYQSPRKAPLPPLAGDQEPRMRHSAQSFGATSAAGSNMSRSNTFNTASTHKSNTSSGTARSHDNSPASGQTPASRKPAFGRNDATPSPSVSAPLHNSGVDWNRTDTSRQAYDIHSSDPSRRTSHDSAEHSSPHKADHKLSVATVDPRTARRGRASEMSKAPEHEGWLNKQSDRYKTWNKRWFVLKNGNLFYFKSPKDVHMKGIISLRGYRIVVDETINPGKYSFKAQHENSRTFYFCTDNKESMKVWVQVLMKATITRDFSTPVMSSSNVSTVPLEVAQRMRPRPPSVLMLGKAQKQPTPDLALSKLDEETPEPYEASEVPEPMYTPTTVNESLAPARPSMATSMDLPTTPLVYDDDEGLESHTGVDENPQNDSVSSGTLSHSSSISGGATPSPTAREWTFEQYLDWINHHLPADQKVTDLTTAFRNGDTLILLLESLSGKTVRRPPPRKESSVSMMMLDNIVAAFKFMGREGVVVNGRFTIKDVFGGNESRILDMVDAIRDWARDLEKDNTTTITPASPLPWEIDDEEPIQSSWNEPAVTMAPSESITPIPPHDPLFEASSNDAEHRTVAY